MNKTAKNILLDFFHHLWYNGKDNLTARLVLMKKVFRIIGEILTGAAAVATLFVGRAMATGEETVENIENIENPVRRGVEYARPDGVPTELFGNTGVFTQITNTALAAVGLIAVIMLIFGGIRYIISGGDQKKVTDAKNTILYAIIGLIISLLAYAIVNFVLNALSA